MTNGSVALSACSNLSGKRKKLVIVLGMHRSGTSAITRGLQALGVDLGGKLIGAIPGDNDKGFWEDSDINGLNNEILDFIGLSWDSLSLLPVGLPEHPSLAGFRIRAVELLRNKVNPDFPLGLKDPRISRLLPFWQPLFEREGFEVGYVIASRNPLSVADSLRKRNGFESEKSYYLWLEHQITAVLATTGQPRLVVEYDHLMEDPARELQRIATALDLSAPDEAGLADYQSEFLAPELRHSHYHGRDLELVPTVPAVVERAYRALCEASEANPHDPLDNLTIAFSEIGKKLSDFAPGFGYMDRQFRELKRLRASCAEQEVQILGNEQHILELESVVGKKDEEILVGREAMLALERRLEECSSGYEQAQSQVRELTSYSGGLMGNIKALTENNAELLRVSSVLEEDYKDAQQQSELLKRECARLDAERAGYEGQLAEVFASKSWRVTAPLRCFRRELIEPVLLLLRKVSSGCAKWIWEHIPLSISSKARLKGLLFRWLPAVFGKTQAYRRWRAMNQPLAESAISQPDLVPVCEAVPAYEGSTFVSLLNAKPLKNIDVRVIAFYLPQFHAIKENDEWWGKGFTEWSNVKPAKPQFDGHYQPHIPGELGYYNLLNKSVQHRQIELAKLYGVSGFCFYYYWFGGKRLLERPIESYLADPALDHPFCLCWANENWSRRWDGLDSQVLIAQQHSPEDDIAFIADIARHMRDPRYIRIDGKPLLLVYRPSLLPDAKATVKRWREWCRDNGLGEIYLAYTQSFESVDPRKYNFDAAIEFPPNNSAPPDVTSQVKLLHDNFAGQVYDWSIFLQRSANYTRPGYKLFRGVCPSWDNTARRKSRGISFVNSSPRGYQEWLLNALRETVENAGAPGEKMVFVNAWNEWAEGAHLEPDARYGYAFLEATRMAQLRSEIMTQADRVDISKVAVIVHAYYPEILQEIVDYLRGISFVRMKLYVTTTSDKLDVVRGVLDQQSHDFEIITVENRGRDVLPFIHAALRAISDGYGLILKVHTKKSKHRGDGDVWRKDLYEKLLSEESVKRALAMFGSNNSLGILGPDGHIVRMDYYWGSNARTVEQLATRLGVTKSELMDLEFVAGTMFFARIEALRPLLELGFSEDNFEPETGQVDGTLAHAIERLFAVSARSVGMTVDSFEDTKMAIDYPFAVSAK